ncbi:MAG: HEPN domain-containing protein [PVC group bacterium]|nr:HEPN domain-containing protein [PVC group bacterium]
MARKSKTRDVNKCNYSNYLKRAEECFRATQNSIDKSDWTAATINAVHACIAGCDAVCVYYLGKRHAGESHGEAVKLFRTVKPGNKEMDTNAGRLTRILSIKNIAEYEDRLIYESESGKILKDTDRFLAFVKKLLP